MTRAPVFPVRLKRGVPLVPRPPGLLQVGADPEQRILLPDTPTVRGFLTDLGAGGAERPRHGELTRVLDRLCRSGLVVDLDERASLRRVRSGRPVRLHGPDPWVGDLQDLLTAAGVHLSSREDDLAAEVVISAGEPSRTMADAFVADAVPVLYVSAVDACVRVGPLVVPGLTACLRCLDAHAQDQEAHHPPALGPAARPPLEFPLDLAPLAMTSALALAANDVLAWVEQRRPVSWSASTWVTGDLSSHSRRWTRHPHCGCAWQDQLQVG